MCHVDIFFNISLHHHIAMWLSQDPGILQGGQGPRKGRSFGIFILTSKKKQILIFEVCANSIVHNNAPPGNVAGTRHGPYVLRCCQLLAVGQCMGFSRYSGFLHQ